MNPAINVDDTVRPYHGPADVLTDIELDYASLPILCHHRDG